MFHLGDQGAVELPIILIFCVLLAAFAIGLGANGLDRVKAIQEDQKSIRSFDRLVEVGTELSYGGVGGERKIRLEVFSGFIEVSGSLIQLRKGNEILRAEELPLPLLKSDLENYSIRSGSFRVKLKELDSGSKNLAGYDLFLKLTELEK